MKRDEKPLVDAKYLLEKFPGKGGWTYAEIPEILQNKNNPFGWVVVKGRIDDYIISNYKLMPMGGGKLFLPVKAEIRKKIKKKEGDFVNVVLYPDNSEIKIPNEIIECFKTESPQLFEKFKSLTQGEQKTFLDWIYQAKTEDTKINRIALMMKRLEENLNNSGKNKNLKFN